MATVEQVRRCLVEIIELADQDALELLRKIQNKNIFFETTSRFKLVLFYSNYKINLIKINSLPLYN